MISYDGEIKSIFNLKFIYIWYIIIHWVSMDAHEFHDFPLKPDPANMRQVWANLPNRVGNGTLLSDISIATPPPLTSRVVSDLDNKHEIKS